ncbi:hypothetical protein Q1695_010823 [Nippostrongylus brasiliensis]|nr:hypothetical protein Q1695_010823 [Nippostrongylus brasiliensis]
MSQKKKKRLLDVPGLPKPWLAYMHLTKKKTFYHNPKTGQSLWELPTDVLPRCSSSVCELGSKLNQVFAVSADIDENEEAMEWADSTGNSPAEIPPNVDGRTKSVVHQDSREAMEIDFSEDVRQMRGVHYDREELTQGENEAQTFSPDGSSRCCVVIDTCAVIEDPELIDCCLDREVILAVPYRVFYELDNMRKITSTSTSTVQLRQRATRIVHMFRNLMSSPFVYWESSSQSFAPVEGFTTSSNEDVNDDFILKCAYRVKRQLDELNDGWETVFVTNDNILSLKAHANNVPCFSGKEAKKILQTPRQKVDQPNKKNCSTPSSSKERLPPGPRPSPKRKEAASSSLDKVKSKSTIKKKSGKELTSSKPAGNLEGTDSLTKFSKMWTDLISVLTKKSKKNIAKTKKDIDRLRENVSNYLDHPSEKSLSLLVRMTSWLHLFYFPPARQAPQSIGYEEIMRGGLFQQISASTSSSERITQQFRQFQNQFGNEKLGNQT